MTTKSEWFQRPLFDYPDKVESSDLEERVSAVKPTPAKEPTNIGNLEALRERVLQCTKCQLRQGAKGVVFGEGNRQARIMFIGEAPGKTEDDTGKPFVGRAGQLLDSMLESYGFSRNDVFITNIVKCRPPGNRMPTDEEVKACLPHLTAQIRLIKPWIIVLLGALSCQTLIDPGLRVTRDRGKWFERDGIMYLVTFHPAAVLRDEAGKKPLMLDDMKSLKMKYHELANQRT